MDEIYTGDDDNDDHTDDANDDTDDDTDDGERGNLHIIKVLSASVREPVCHQGSWLLLRNSQKRFIY